MSTLINASASNPDPESGLVVISVRVQIPCPLLNVNTFLYGPNSTRDSKTSSSAFLRAASSVRYAYANARPCNNGLTPGRSSLPDIETYRLETEPNAELSTYRLVAATKPSYTSSSSGSGSRAKIRGPVILPNAEFGKFVAGSIALTPALAILLSA